MVLPDSVGVGSSGAVLGMLASWIVWIVFRWYALHCTALHFEHIVVCCILYSAPSYHIRADNPEKNSRVSWLQECVSPNRSFLGPTEDPPTPLRAIYTIYMSVFAAANTTFGETVVLN
jgi:hypothetical protein